MQFGRLAACRTANYGVQFDDNKFSGAVATAVRRRAASSWSSMGVQLAFCFFCLSFQVVAAEDAVPFLLQLFTCMPCGSLVIIF